MDVLYIYVYIKEITIKIEQFFFKRTTFKLQYVYMQFLIFFGLRKEENIHIIYVALLQMWH